MNKAISFAAYGAAVDLFPGDQASVFDPLMRRLGYDPANTTDNIAARVGNVAALAVLEFRHRDGANQLGDEPGGKFGAAYSDYTGYKSTNDPMDLRPDSKFDSATVHDPNRGSSCATSMRAEPTLPNLCGRAMAARQTGRALKRRPVTIADRSS